MAIPHPSRPEWRIEIDPDAHIQTVHPPRYMWRCVRSDGWVGPDVGYANIEGAAGKAATDHVVALLDAVDAEHPMAPPLPTLTPHPRFAVCPPPQPGMLVTVLPPPTMLGAPVLHSLILATAGDAVFIAVPGGIMPLSRASWPPDDVVAVHSALGDLLWDRRAVAVDP